MATVYSLVVFGGRTGKAVTFTDAGDIVNLTNNGLIAGTEIFFETTGSLPTGLSTITTYFARPGADNNKFLLYPTEADAIAGTNQVTFSGTGSGTHTVKAKAMTDYLAAYPGRWGDSGSERVYDGVASWVSARAGASSLNEEVCEIGMAFTELISARVDIDTGAYVSYVTTKVDGEFSDGFHFGDISAGYLIKASGFYSGGVINANGYRSTIEGIRVDKTLNSSSFPAVDLGMHASARKCVVFGYGTTTNVAILSSNSKYFTTVTDNVVPTGGIGYQIGSYQYGGLVAGNIAYGCGTGFSISTTGNAALSLYNNISVGNTTNWSPTAWATGVSSKNAGLSGEPPTGSPIVIATTDFANAAGGDFSPAAITSPQVNTGSDYYGQEATDITDTVRPGYQGSAEGTSVSAGSFVTGLTYSITSVGTTDFTAIGASANTVGVVFKATGAGSGTGVASITHTVDVGPYEYDHGYGPWPATATISLTNIVSGSRVRITKASDGTELYNDVPGTSLSHSTSHIGDFNVVVRKASASPYYREFVASGTTVADQTTTIKCLQQLDE